ncbi:MAG: hypothetical protein MZV70_28940 [Desulfobacterales bacterium]|nr:hypothetical protein [Desulfobacterales bacterium]
MGLLRHRPLRDRGRQGQQPAAVFLRAEGRATPRATPYSVADLTTLEARFTAATIGGKATEAAHHQRQQHERQPLGHEAALPARAAGAGRPPVGGSERVFTKPLVVGGIVFFTTFIPDADICTGSGDTYVFALDYKTGMPPDARRSSTSTGTASSPTPTRCWSTAAWWCRSASTSAAGRVRRRYCSRTPCSSPPPPRRPGRRRAAATSPD